MEGSFQEASPGSPQGTKRPRSMLKCDACREKKCKVSFRGWCLAVSLPIGNFSTVVILTAVQCLPYPRVWPGVKCDACVKGGRECGPNTHFRSSPSSTGSSAPIRGLAMPVSPSSTPPSISTSTPHVSRSDRPYSAADLFSTPESASGISAWSLTPIDQAYGGENPVASIKKGYVFCSKPSPTGALELTE
jgi:hypothetical protein